MIDTAHPRRLSWRRGSQSGSPRRRGPRRILLLALAIASPVIWVQVASDDAATEASAGSPRLRDRVIDVRRALNSLSEEIEDLGEPVEEFETFDQCMYQLGVTQYGRREGRIGYVFGRRRHRAAFAIDIRGLDTSQYRFLAFPGEEPPSIECNEDAGGQFTN